MKRNRIHYFLLLVTTVALGLASRRYASQLPEWVGLYLGDLLWALMVFLLLGFAFRTQSPARLALVAWVFSCLIEVSQLYHAPWIDAIRSNRLGGLVLGFGFLWSDLLSYSAGIALGFLLEFLFIKIKGWGKPA